MVGLGRQTDVDEDRTLARLRALRSDLIDPTIAVHKARVVKGAVDGALVEFRSAVDAVRCAIEVHDAIVERNAGVPADRTRVLAGQDWTRLTVSHPMAKRGGVGPSAKRDSRRPSRGSEASHASFDVARRTKRVDRN